MAALNRDVQREVLGKLLIFLFFSNVAAKRKRYLSDTYNYFSGIQGRNYSSHVFAVYFTMAQDTINIINRASQIGT